MTDIEERLNGLENKIENLTNSFNSLMDILKARHNPDFECLKVFEDEWDKSLESKEETSEDNQEEDLDLIPK